MYSCERCKYQTKLSADLKKHLNRKNTCEPKYSNISVKELLKKLKKNGEYKCELCKKTYMYCTSLTRHQKECILINKD